MPISYEAQSCPIHFELHNIFFPRKDFQARFSKVYIGAACPADRLAGLVKVWAHERPKVNKALHWVVFEGLRDSACRSGHGGGTGQVEVGMGQGGVRVHWTCCKCAQGRRFLVEVPGRWM